MKVCVVGAGPSGLTTIKQLRDEGHEVVCFEANDDIGGIWYRHDADCGEMKVFDNLILTVSMKLMSYSDYMHKGPRTFTDHRGYLEYLHRYTAEYHLRPHIVFQTKVHSIRKDGDHWTVQSTNNDALTDHRFDAVAVCTGPFKTPNRMIPGIEGFAGRVTHSSEYRNSHAFAGKRVLVVGLAESGADIVREVGEASTECTLAIRSYTFLLPRLFKGRHSTDNYTFRAHHYEIWVRAANLATPFRTIWGERAGQKFIFLLVTSLYGLAAALLIMVQKSLQWLLGHRSDTQTNNLGQAMYPLKLDIGTENTQANADAIDAWNRKSHHDQGSWTPKAIFCKNVSFIPGIVRGKIRVNDAGLDRFEGHRVYFKDGSSSEFDEIVLCTGFVHDYSILGEQSIEDNDVRNLYKHCIHPDHQGRLAVIGLVRPFSGGIPICSEMQARYFAQLCSNKLKLPPHLPQVIAREKKWEQALTALSPRHTESFPSQIMFLDSLAKEIGCLMPLHRLLLHPRLLVRHWFYSFNQSCYRLTGPHNMHESAKAELLSEELPTDSVKHIPLMALSYLFPHFVHPKDTTI